MKQYILSALALLGFATGLSGCNDDFPEVYPRTSLTEQNAFETYDNFKAYAYPLYGMFTDARILTNFSGGCYHRGGQKNSDFWAGIMTHRDNGLNPYAFQTFTAVTTSSNWNFGYIRTINIMLSKIDGSKLSDAEKNHWRSVGCFFHSLCRTTGIRTSFLCDIDRTSCLQVSLSKGSKRSRGKSRSRCR